MAVGGVLGACAREELARTLPAAPGAFPVGTFAVNLSGSFALGLLLTLLVERWQAHELLRPLVATGVIGAYTTWSTFMVDVVTLVRDGQVGMAAGYAGASLVAGLAAVFAGMVIARSGLPGRVPSGLGAGRRGSRSRSSEKEEVGG